MRKRLQLRPVRWGTCNAFLSLQSSGASTGMLSIKLEEGVLKIYRMRFMQQH